MRAASARTPRSRLVNESAARWPLLSDGLPFDAYGYYTASILALDTLTVTMVEAASSSVNVVKVLCAP